MTRRRKGPRRAIVEKVIVRLHPCGFSGVMDVRLECGHRFDRWPFFNGTEQRTVFCPSCGDGTLPGTRKSDEPPKKP